ncbi:MAG: N5,N10-methylenetetrahydromethanopterin reductase-related protein, BCG_3584c family, partial [uncultured Nocardioidaceae bacterium]
ETWSAAGLLGRAAARRCRGARGRRRGRGLRRRLHRGGLGLRRLHPPGMVGTGDEPGPAGHLDRADVRSHADVDRDARPDPRPPLRRALRARDGRLGAAGGGGLVRPAVRQAARAHPRGRRHHPPGAGPRGGGDQRRAALPSAVRRSGLGRPGQAVEADHPPAACGHPDLAGRRRTEERRPDGRDRRRVDPDLLHAEVRGHVPAVARRGLRPPGRAAHAGDVRDRRDLPPADHRRPPAGHRLPQAGDRALHGWHGCQGPELPQERLRADGVRRDHRPGAGAVPCRQAGRGDRTHPRRARRGAAHHRRRGEGPGQDPGVGVDGREHVAAVVPQPRGGPRGRGGRAGL